MRKVARLAQSRKKAIMEQVEKQRRRNRLVTLGAIVLIAVVIVAVVIALPKSGNAVQLPDYLNRCVVSSLLYHSHPTLSIVINGSTFTIPATLGIQGACNRPIHTHDATGTLHVETDENRDYTLGDFFLVWGNWANNAQLAIFNSNQIFGGHVVSGHNLTMTVNQNPVSSFQNYVLPRNAGTPNPTNCPNCQPDNIVITYT